MRAVITVRAIARLEGEHCAQDRNSGGNYPGGEEPLKRCWPTSAKFWPESRQYRLLNPVITTLMKIIEITKDSDRYVQINISLVQLDK